MTVSAVSSSRGHRRKFSAGKLLSYILLTFGHVNHDRALYLDGLDFLKKPAAAFRMAAKLDPQSVRLE